MRRNQRKRPIIVCLLVTALLLTFFAGCGSTTSDRPTVTIGYLNNGATPEMAAITSDLFSKRMHADIQLKQFDSGPAAMTALASGALQIMTGIGNPPAVSAISRGVPLHVVYVQNRYTHAEGLVVRQSAGIHSLKDLQGKTVAMVLGSTSPFEFDTALKRAGVDPSTVHKLNMAPPAMVAAWHNHSLDAAYVWSPVFNTIGEDDGKVLMTDEDVKDQAPIFTLSVANSDWAQKNPELVKQFVQVEDEAVKWYKQRPEDALKVMAQGGGISLAMAKTEVAGYEIYDAKDQLSAKCLGAGQEVSSSMVTKSLVAASEYLHEIGLITSMPAHIEQNVDSSYARQIGDEQSQRQAAAREGRQGVR